MFGRKVNENKVFFRYLSISRHWNYLIDTKFCNILYVFIFHCEVPNGNSIIVTGTTCSPWELSRNLLRLSFLCWHATYINFLQILPRPLLARPLPRHLLARHLLTRFLTRHLAPITCRSLWPNCLHKMSTYSDYYSEKFIFCYLPGKIFIRALKHNLTKTKWTQTHTHTFIFTILPFVFKGFIWISIILSCFFLYLELDSRFLCVVSNLQAVLWKSACKLFVRLGILKACFKCNLDRHEIFSGNSWFQKTFIKCFPDLYFQH